jgi:LacI family transcriptional regulator
VIFDGNAVKCLKAVEFCREKQIPAIALLATPGFPPPLATVDYCRREAGEKAAAYLMDCGFRSIGYIGEVAGGDSKFMGLLNGLAGRNVSLESRHILELPSLQSLDSVCRKLASMGEAGDLPQAFFVDTDCKAMAVIDFLATRGLRVPDDVSILGYDDFPGAGDFRVPLTTVRIPRRQIAAQAVETLFSLNPKNTPEVKMVPVEFSIVERSSVRPIVSPAKT